jgi:hypothetical protein
LLWLRRSPTQTVTPCPVYFGLHAAGRRWLAERPAGSSLVLVQAMCWCMVQGVIPMQNLAFIRLTSPTPVTL